MSRKEIIGRRLSFPRATLQALPMVLVAVSFSACGPRDSQDATASPASTEAPAPASTPAAAAPRGSSEAPSAPARAFFLRPQEGDVVRPAFRARFGVENFSIEAVGDGAVHAGTGHYHLGVDTDCRSAGEIIPRTAPWIDLSDGSSDVALQLAPGVHRLCLQVGDGEHRALAGDGMSEQVTITVEEEEPRSEQKKA